MKRSCGSIFPTPLLLTIYIVSICQYSGELLGFKAPCPWPDLSVIPQLCFSEVAQLCFYHWWFRHLAHVSLRALFFLSIPVTQLRLFFCFSMVVYMYVHGLPIDSGRLHGVPCHYRLCDLCRMGVVGDEHQLYLCVAGPLTLCVSVSVTCLPLALVVYGDWFGRRICAL